MLLHMIKISAYFVKPSQPESVQFDSFITLSDSDYDPKINANAFLDPMWQFTCRLIQLCIIYKAIHAFSQIYSGNCIIESCTLHCISFKMFILVLTCSILQCRMFMVLTANKTSRSALLRRNTECRKCCYSLTVSQYFVTWYTTSPIVLQIYVNL